MRKKQGTSCTSSPNLPSGIAIDSSNCTISGTPTASQASTSYTITASNSAGSISSKISATVVAVSLMGGTMQGNPLSLTPTVSIFAGTAGSNGSTDGTGTTARFKVPEKVTTDKSNLYVADLLNHTIRKIVIATGVVTTLAGTAGTTGSADATGTAATFNAPWGITTDGTNLYVTERDNHTVRKIVISTAAVTTVAGSAGTTDATGTSARFNLPDGLVTDGTDLYLTDVSNHTIRKIVASTGAVTTLAGTGSFYGSS